MHERHHIGPCIALRLLAASIPGLAAGCLPSHTVVLHGDANSADISYGGDIDGATRAARDYCSRFERVPKLNYADRELAHFYCVAPNAP